MDVWVESELAGCEFPDQRLEARLGKLLTDLGRKIGSTLPTACQDWAATKAAYRFFDNDRVDESIILAGHFVATQARIAATSGPILIVHDTTEFSFQRERPEAIGKTKILPNCRIAAQRITKCGLLMHSSLAVTTEGQPLGLLAVKFWTRKKFKGTNAIKGRGIASGEHSVNFTRIPIEKKESVRWIENLRQATALLDEASRGVHIGDRESDIYELFCAAEETKSRFLVRTCVDRRAEDGKQTVLKVMNDERVKAVHRVEVVDAKGRPSTAVLEMKYHRLQVCPPIGKEKRYPNLMLTVIHAVERGKPKDRAPIEWKLLTNLPVTCKADAVEKLDWYAQRWKIETFHKILKSGCKAEDAKLRSAARLTNLIAVFCIIGWRVFWLTMAHRTNPKSSADEVFTKNEIMLLDHIAGTAKSSGKRPLTDYVTVVAKLGGYLARANDPPPGNMVLWRGMVRLTDIHFGFNLSRELVGN